VRTHAGSPPTSPRTSPAGGSAAPGTASTATPPRGRRPRRRRGPRPGLSHRPASSWCAPRAPRASAFRRARAPRSPWRVAAAARRSARRLARMRSRRPLVAICSTRQAPQGPWLRSGSLACCNSPYGGDTEAMAPPSPPRFPSRPWKPSMNAPRRAHVWMDEPERAGPLIEDWPRRQEAALTGARRARVGWIEG